MKRSSLFDRFTESARKSMSSARAAAFAWNHDYIGTEHVLLGIIDEGTGVGAAALRELGVDPAAVRAEVEGIVKPGTRPVTQSQLPITPRAKRVLELSVEAAQSLGHDYIGTEHLLIALVAEGEGIAARVLVRLGATTERVWHEVTKLLGIAAPPPPPNPAAPPAGRDRLREANFMLVGGALLGVAGLIGDWLVPRAGGLALIAGELLVVMGLLRRAAASTRARLRAT